MKESSRKCITHCCKCTVDTVILMNMALPVHKRGKKRKKKKKNAFSCCFFVASHRIPVKVQTSYPVPNYCIIPHFKHHYREETPLTFTCCKLLGIQYARFLQGSDAGVHQLQASGELVFYVLLSVYAHRHRTRDGNYIESGFVSGHQQNAKADEKSWHSFSCNFTSHLQNCNRGRKSSQDCH